MPCWNVVISVWCPTVVAKTGTSQLKLDSVRVFVLDFAQAIDCFCQRHGNAKWLVGYSGGMDSHALLYALSQRAQAHNSLRAIYINHGLQAEAMEWQRHCQAQCKALGVAFEAIAVDAAKKPGESQEQSARNARYAALIQQLDETTVLITGHHQRDQVETFLLQLMRGAGSLGLSAMPGSKPLGPGLHARPLLCVPFQQIQSYACQQQLYWINDGSNQDTDIRRNYVRHQVLPVLEATWPRAQQRMASTVTLLQEAQSLLDELAEEDWQRVRCPDGRAPRLLPFLTLSEKRQANLLRYWLRGKGVSAPGERKTREFLRQLNQSNQRTQVQCQWGPVNLRVLDERLVLVNTDRLPSLLQSLPLHFGSSLQYQSLFRLNVQQDSAPGLCPPDAGVKVNVCFRSGGERIKPWRKQHHCDLKQLFQEHNVPEWLRPLWPLLYYDQTLVAVPGLCTAADYAEPLGINYRPEWLHLL